MLTAMAVFAVLVLAWGSPRARHLGGACAVVARWLVPEPHRERMAARQARRTMSVTK